MLAGCLTMLLCLLAVSLCLLISVTLSLRISVSVYVHLTLWFAGDWPIALLLAAWLDGSAAHAMKEALAQLQQAPHHSLGTGVYECHLLTHWDAHVSK